MSKPDNRAEGRSNVFLAATLTAGKGPRPVRIRNIAPRGALVEAPSLPPVGTRVILARRELSATGELAWEGSGQAGLSFDEPIDIESWVKKVGHVGQQSVDRVVAAIRETGQVPTEWKGSDGPTTLVGVSTALDSVCERLSAMPEMSLELGEALVKLDTIAQALRRIATGKAF